MRMCRNFAKEILITCGFNSTLIVIFFFFILSEVCLIDDAGTSDDTNGSPKTKKCLSDEDRNPRV